MNRQYFSIFILLLVVGIGLSFAILLLETGERYTAETAERIVHFELYRPTVYRVLVPALANGLTLLGLSAEISLTIMIVLSTLGLFHSVKYLYGNPAEPLSSIVAFGAVAVTAVVISRYGKAYDMATAFLFTGCLGLLSRSRFKEYYLLFPLATLNRETTFLLIAFFAVYYFRRLSLDRYLIGLGYQVIEYFMIRILTIQLFADKKGVVLLWRPEGVVREYLDNPHLTVPLLLITALVVWLVITFWNRKSHLLRSAFLIMAPLLLVMHLLMGYAFEIRVFAEIVPVTFLLAVFSVAVYRKEVRSYRYASKAQNTLSR